MGQRCSWLVALVLAVTVVGCVRQGEGGTGSGASVMTPQPDGAAASGEADAGVSSAAPAQPQPEVSVETVPGGPMLGMSFWKTEVLPFEPILLRIELTNPTDEPVRVVPTYPGCEYCMALCVSVWREDGTQVEGMKLPGRPVFPWQGYYGDGYPWSATPRAPLPPRLPIDLAPGETRFMWLDLLRHFTFDEPGKYHLEFGYESDPAMLTGDDPRAQLETVLRIPRVEIDAGWITVTEPNRAERKAADLILQYRESQRMALSAHGPEYPGEQVVAATPGSDYVPWVEFVEARVRATDPLKPTDAQANEFVSKHPDFALAYQLAVLAELGRYRKASIWVDEPKGELRMGAYDGTLTSERRTELEALLEETMPRLDAARQALLTAARESGDFELYQLAETTIWKAEAWRRLEPLAPAGTESSAASGSTTAGE